MPKPNQSVDEFVRERIKEAVNTFHDAHGVVRPGREPDYLNGRWCVKCHNSLPEGWRRPCDVCGFNNGPISLDGLVGDKDA